MAELRAWTVGVLLSILLTAAPVAAEVAVLKSTDAPGWRPALDALRKGLTGPDHQRVRPARRPRGGGPRGGDAQGPRRGDPRGHGGPRRAGRARGRARDRRSSTAWCRTPARLGLLNNVNAAGVAFATPVKNQLAAFRMVNPRGVRIGVLYGEESSRLVQEAQKAAAVVRLAIVPRPIASEREVPQALRTLLTGTEAVDALWLPLDPLLLGDETRRFLLAETLKAGKPVYSFSSALVSEGALVSNGADIASIGEQAAELVGRLARRGPDGARGPAGAPRGAGHQQEDRGEAPPRDPGGRVEGGESRVLRAKRMGMA